MQRHVELELRLFSLRRYTQRFLDYINLLKNRYNSNDGRLSHMLNHLLKRTSLSLLEILYLTHYEQTPHLGGVDIGL